MQITAVTNFMDDNKFNNEEEVVIINEESEEEKIGFNSKPPLKEGEKIERFQKNLPGKTLRGWTKAMTILSIILSCLTIMYFLLPLFSALIGGLIGLCIALFMICSVVVTLGLILTNDGYRNWISNDMMDVPNFFFNLADNITKLSPYFLCVAIPAIICGCIGLTLSIIGQSKKYRFFVSYIVLNSIFLTLSLLFTILYFIGGIVSKV